MVGWPPGGLTRLAPIMRLAPLVLQLSVAHASLFFAEYAEGSSNNKYFEVYQLG